MEVFSKAEGNFLARNSKKQRASRKTKYKRVILKLSGEALREVGSGDNISPQIVNQTELQIKPINELGVETAIVIGDGNIWRGLSASHRDGKYRGTVHSAPRSGGACSSGEVWHQ